jgi:hypothetical protein
MDWISITYGVFLAQSVFWGWFLGYGRKAMKPVIVHTEVVLIDVIHPLVGWNDVEW